MGDSMSSISILGDTSGSVLLQAPAIAGSTTVNIGATTGTIQAGAPLFSAYAGSTTSLTNASPTQLIYNVKSYDTNTCYNNTGSTVTLNGISTPAYSFAPNVAGYYLITANHYVGFTGGSSNTAFEFFKNGSLWSINNGVSGSSNTYFQSVTVVYCNGTSDYISAYLYWTGSGAVTGSGQYYQFTGNWIRGA